MSSHQNSILDLLRSIFTGKGQNSICASNSILPINPANSQPETVNGDGDELSVIVVSPRLPYPSGSETPEVQLSPAHSVIEVQEHSDSFRRRAVPRAIRDSWRDPFLVRSRPASGDEGNSGESGAQNKPSQYLQRYYDLMFYTGFCTYRARYSTRGKLTWWVVVGIFQKTIFWTLAILSAFQSLCLSKYFLLDFMEGREYYSGVSLGHHFACFMAKMYAIMLFGFKKSKTDEMLHEMEKYENSANVATSSWKRKLVLVLFISTIALGIAQTIADGNDEKGNGIIVTSSQEFVVDLFVWKSKNFTNVTTALEEKYAKKMTSTTITFAYVVITRDMSSYMVLGIMFDLVVLVGSVVYAYVKAFIKDVKEVTANVPEENVDEWNRLQAKREVVWGKYRNLRAVISAVNAVFDPLLKLMHGGNLLMFAFFMALCVFCTNTTWVSLLLYARDLVKVEVGYYIAGRIAEVNDIIRAWIRNWALYTGKIKVGDKLLDANMVLDELEKDPIGLGKGNFLIHHTFHFKFLGLVGSVFFSMSDEEKNA